MSGENAYMLFLEKQTNRNLKIYRHIFAQEKNVKSNNNLTTHTNITITAHIICYFNVKITESSASQVLLHVSITQIPII